MKLGIKKDKKDIKEKQRQKVISVIFRSRGFWGQFGWLLFMCAGCVIAIAVRSIVLFTAVLVSAFLGLNEFGRWKYKTNLVFCSAVAIAGSLAGVFNWLETGSIFLMMCIVGSFVLYYRDTVRALYPAMSEFSDVLSYCTTESDVAFKAHAMLQKMLPDCRIFVLVSDGVTGLYVPEHRDKPRKKLNRGGGVVWKCFASGVPYRRNFVAVERDLPLYREARSIIAAPMTAQGEAIGVIEIESRTPSFFSSDDKDRLCLLAFLTGQALAKINNNF